MNNHHIPPASIPLQVSRQNPATPPERILVVDDDSDAQLLIAEMLRRAGYKVDTAKDGADAWSTLQIKAYDLLITDNSMPNMSGVELLKNLRASRLVLPVIMATGAPPARAFAESPWLIPEATITRPFTMDELLGTIETVLHAADSPRSKIDPPPTLESQ